MEQPKFPAASPQRPATAVNDNNQEGKKKRRPPSPEEVLAFYESQGFDTRSASLKAIEDLQSLLLRGGGSSSRRNSLSAAGDLNRKLDNANTRLAILEMKLDSKPGFPESLAIALASGSLIHGLASALPPAISALAGAWRSVASATTARPPSS